MDIVQECPLFKKYFFNLEFGAIISTFHYFENQGSVKSIESYPSVGPKSKIWVKSDQNKSSPRKRWSGKIHRK